MGKDTPTYTARQCLAMKKIPDFLASNLELFLCFVCLIIDQMSIDSQTIPP